MVLGNKWVLDSISSLPLLFLWLQILVAVLLLTVSHAVGWLPPLTRPLGPASSISGKLLRLLPHTDMKKARQLWPLIAINVIGLSFNTLCLKYIEASLYQVSCALDTTLLLVL
jgi:GDP-fucose transporter C1